MAEIAMYGTLLNDTGEPIAYSTQVKDPETGKSVNEMISEIESGGSSEWLTIHFGPAPNQQPDQEYDWNECPIGLVGTEGYQLFQIDTNFNAVENIGRYVGVRLCSDTDTYYIRFKEVVYEDESPDVYFEPVTIREELLNVGFETRSGSGYIRLTRVEESEEPTGLTPWQENYLKGLEEAEVKSKYGVTMTLSKTSQEITGESTEITVYVTPKYDGANVEAVVVGTSGNLTGKTFTRDSQGRYVTTVTVAAPADVKNASITETFGVKVTYTHPQAGALEKTATASFVQYAYSAIVTSPSQPTSAQVLNASIRKTTLTGSQTIPFNLGDYVYFLVPSQATQIKKVTSSGFDVPMHEVIDFVTVTVGSTTITYKCMRMASKPQTSPMSVVIS